MTHRMFWFLSWFFSLLILYIDLSLRALVVKIVHLLALVLTLNYIHK